MRGRKTGSHRSGARLKVRVRMPVTGSAAFRFGGFTRRIDVSGIFHTRRKAGGHLTDGPKAFRISIRTF